MVTRIVHLPRRSHAFRTSRLVPLAILAVVAIVAACSGSAASIAEPAAAPAGGAYGQLNGTDANGQPIVGAAASPGAVDGSVSGTTENPQDNLLIVKTGTMSLQVAGIDDALAAASMKIGALGGYVSGSQRSGDGDTAAAQATYRIPAAQWDEALVDLRAIGTKVLAEQSQTDDVTGQVVDLGARITNLQATESALQAIMAKADKISDVLAVQAQLTDVRGQIEQAMAEKNHLQQQAAYSTLTVSFSLKEIAVQTASKQFDPGHEIDQASASLVSVLQALATAGIWFGIVWLPILLVVGVLASVVLFVLRRRAASRPGGGGGSGDAQGGSGGGSEAGSASIPPLPEAPSAA